MSKRYSVGDIVDLSDLLTKGSVVDPNGDYPVAYPDGTFKRYTKGYAILELQALGRVDENFEFVKHPVQ
jgi:hypothetical protein